MATGLDRFDEVWAEIENLPSPYLERERELAKLKAQQSADKFDEFIKFQNQIASQGFQPNTMIMHPQTYQDMVEHSLLPADHTEGTGPK